MRGGELQAVEMLPVLLVPAPALFIVVIAGWFEGEEQDCVALTHAHLSLTRSLV